MGMDSGASAGGGEQRLDCSPAAGSDPVAEATSMASFSVSSTPSFRTCTDTSESPSCESEPEAPGGSEQVSASYVSRQQSGFRSSRAVARESWRASAKSSQVLDRARRASSCPYPRHGPSDRRFSADGWRTPDPALYPSAAYAPGKHPSAVRRASADFLSTRASAPKRVTRPRSSEVSPISHKQTQGDSPSPRIDRPRVTLHEGAVIRHGGAEGRPPPKAVAEPVASSRRQFLRLHPASVDSAGRPKKVSPLSPSGESPDECSGDGRGEGLVSIRAALIRSATPVAAAARGLLAALAPVWSSVADSVWRVAVVMGGTCVCCSCAALLLLFLGLSSFVLLRAFVTLPPLAEFPVYFDYSPALSEALSRSPFDRDDSAPSEQPAAGTFSPSSAFSPSSNSSLPAAFIHVNSTWSVSIPASLLPGSSAQGASSFVTRCSTEDVSPLWRHLCPPAPGDMFSSSVRSRLIHPWRGGREVPAWSSSAATAAASAEQSLNYGKDATPRQTAAGFSSATTGALPWAGLLSGVSAPPPASIAVAVVPFSNRSWEFLPADSQMYAPPLPFSLHGKEPGKPAAVPSDGEETEGGAPGSFFASLDASQLPSDHNLDVYLVTSYPFNEWNSRLPPVMISLLFFTSNHNPVAKATRPLLPATPVGTSVKDPAGTSANSVSSFLSLFLPPVFSPVFPPSSRTPQQRPESDLTASLPFFETFPFALTQRLAYAQVLMYPPLHVSAASLVFVPKLRGLRAFLAAHWTAAILLLVLCVLWWWVSCLCCGALGLTYLVLPVGPGDSEGRTDGDGISGGRMRGCDLVREVTRGGDLARSYGRTAAPSQGGRVTSIPRSAQAGQPAGSSASSPYQVGDCVVNRRSEPSVTPVCQGMFSKCDAEGLSSAHGPQHERAKNERHGAEEAHRGGHVPTAAATECNDVRRKDDACVAESTDEAAVSRILFGHTRAAGEGARERRKKMPSETD